ncbi:HNH endonuclease signature motif containing protein [Mesorhizobium sp.]|uniref:HNH endonuclease n=1 Tax=Mesorhizobium sp. TaxID=1871066 RepID=UPI000FE7C810|nr:HNH endonuclease signature motif containing protein [Mesorhizobium sp.]RWK48106.1 MAG: HNH endonuclease [Mesorhizobium sp.]
MPRRTKSPSDAKEHLADLQQLLTDFAAELDKPELRDRVRALVPSFAKIRKLGISLMPELSHAGARDRILAYLQKYPLTVIDGDELMVVSGIGEWARRVRELRVEFGWLINSGATFKDMADELALTDGISSLSGLKKTLGMDPRQMKPSQYVLLTTEQDREAALRWNILNEIRKSKISVKDKILRFLRASVGKPVIGEELRYLASDRSEWPRRVRELRTEEGWPVASQQSGRPDLGVGVYVLERDEQAEPHDRNIPDPVRVEVLQRDKFACRVCGWTRDMASPDDPRRFLELHHIRGHKDRGTNTTDNLITICNVHHDEVHRSKEAAARVAAIPL